MKKEDYYDIASGPYAALNSFALGLPNLLSKFAPKEIQDDFKKMEERNPISSTIGNVVGAVGSMAIPGGAVLKGAANAANKLKLGKLASNLLSASNVAKGLTPVVNNKLVNAAIRGGLLSAEQAVPRTIISTAADTADKGSFDASSLINMPAEIALGATLGAGGSKLADVMKVNKLARAQDRVIGNLGVTAADLRKGAGFNANKAGKARRILKTIDPIKENAAEIIAKNNLFTPDDVLKNSTGESEIWNTVANGYNDVVKAKIASESGIKPVIKDGNIIHHTFKDNTSFKDDIISKFNAMRFDDPSPLKLIRSEAIKRNKLNLFDDIYKEIKDIEDFSTARKYLQDMINAYNRTSSGDIDAGLKSQIAIAFRDRIGDLSADAAGVGDFAGLKENWRIDRILEEGAAKKASQMPPTGFAKAMSDLSGKGVGAAVGGAIGGPVGAAVGAISGEPVTKYLGDKFNKIALDKAMKTILNKDKKGIFNTQVLPKLSTLSGTTGGALDNYEKGQAVPVELKEEQQKEEPVVNKGPLKNNAFDTVALSRLKNVWVEKYASKKGNRVPWRTFAKQAYKAYKGKDGHFDPYMLAQSDILFKGELEKKNFKKVLDLMKFKNELNFGKETDRGTDYTGSVLDWNPLHGKYSAWGNKNIARAQIERANLKKLLQNAISASGNTEDTLYKDTDWHINQIIKTNLPIEEKRELLKRLVDRAFSVGGATIEGLGIPIPSGKKE